MKTDPYIEAGLPSDEELEVLTDYIGGYMTAADVEVFEKRMVEDEAFFFRVAPVLDAWYMGRPAQVELVRDEKTERVPRITVPRSWRRNVVAFASLAAAVTLFFVARPRARVEPTLPPTVATVPTQPPPDTSASPGTAPPVVAPVHHHITKHAPAPVMAVTELAQPDPVLVTIDSAAEAAIATRFAAVDSAQAATAFIASGRVADTVGVHAPPVAIPPMITVGSQTELKTSTGVGAGAVGNRVGAVWGAIKGGMGAILKKVFGGS
jgi:hypothetical protein